MWGVWGFGGLGCLGVWGGAGGLGGLWGGLRGLGRVFSALERGEGGRMRQASFLRIGLAGVRSWNDFGLRNQGLGFWA